MKQLEIDFGVELDMPTNEKKNNSAQVIDKKIIDDFDTLYHWTHIIEIIDPIKMERLKIWI